MWKTIVSAAASALLVVGFVLNRGDSFCRNILGYFTCTPMPSQFLSYHRPTITENTMFELLAATSFFVLWMLSYSAIRSVENTIVERNKDRIQAKSLRRDTKATRPAKAVKANNPLPRGLNSNLDIDMIAKIVEPGGMHLRAFHSLNVDAIDWMPKGRKVRILAGPIYHETLIWWFIDYEGFMGWAFEGDGYDEVYIKPA